MAVGATIIKGIDTSAAYIISRRSKAFRWLVAALGQKFISPLLCLDLGIDPSDTNSRRNLPFFQGKYSFSDARQTTERITLTEIGLD